ncbi:MAG: C39 family peptidase [Chloroflexi bacterium]|nr:C39 family peptidase [Chloroflexota bacterium]
MSANLQSDNNCNLNVTLYKQGLPHLTGASPSWEDDAYGNPSGSYGTVAQYGCAMTSSAMMLNHQGIAVDPGQLNTWLRSQADGYKGGALNWVAVARYAREHGVNLYYHGKLASGTSADSYLSQAVCDLSLPVVLDVSGLGGTSSHFVLATGQTEVSGQQTWAINDPVNWASPRTTLQAYSFQYSSVRVFNAVQQGAIVAGGTDTIQVLVTDPLGRRLGVRADGSTVSEIPNATYSTESIDDDNNPGEDSTPPERVAEIIEPIDGTYIVQIFGVGAGDYRMHFFSYDDEQNPNGTDVFEERPDRDQREPSSSTTSRHPAPALR